jgi:hypothetical protein
MRQLAGRRYRVESPFGAYRPHAASGEAYPIDVRERVNTSVWNLRVSAKEQNQEPRLFPILGLEWRF